jgi:hypothetical protein
MPRASWRGFLRLSLVSCPIYLSPAASRTKPIRLRVWRPGLADEVWISTETGPQPNLPQPTEIAGENTNVRGPDRRRSGPHRATILNALSNS